MYTRMVYMDGFQTEYRPIRADIVPQPVIRICLIYGTAYK